MDSGLRRNDEDLRSLALLLKPLMVSLSNHVATPFDKLRVSGSCAQFSNQRKGR
jgi:hypothetical protein